MYAALQYSVDTQNQAYAALSDQGRSLSAHFRATIAFAEPELMAIGSQTLQEWITQEPNLAIYAHYFDQLNRRQPHIRSTEVEEILSLVSDPFRTTQNIHGVLANAEMRFAPAVTSQGEHLEIGQGNIGKLLSSPDRETRRTAWENYADTHLALKNTLANCQAAGIKIDVFNARARHYPNSLEASLYPHNIPPAVFYNLIETFKRYLPVWQRYWRLRKRALNLDPFYVYDIRAPLIENMPEVPFDQAVEWVCAGLQPLGEEYVSILRDGVTQKRWVDRYPNKGKRMGAFSWGAPTTQPYLFLNYNHDVFSLSTLAHELGHSLHSYYTWQNQPLVYANYSLFVAEVASNFNQAMVRAYLLETETAPEMQIALLEEAMANFQRYFFTMPTLARFELAIHEQVENGQALTAQSLNDLLADLFAEGYGEEISLDRERVGITWAQFHTHLYSNFYVYQYATGISGAHALAERVLSGSEKARQDYLAFLKAGGSLYPLEALQLAGVDLTSPEPVERTFRLMESYVTRLENLLT
jgi:oligoendopeptidase F